MRHVQRCLFLVPLVLFLGPGCQVIWDKPESPLPQFPDRIPVPVSIQILEERPSVEIGGERSKDWIYYTRAPEAHGRALGTYLGNALNVMGAVPAYTIVGKDVPPDAVSHLIQLRLIHAYARWPVNPDQRKDQVPVQGASEIRITLYLNGEPVHSDTMKHKQADFLVPVRIIRPGMARKVVGDSLTHQFERTIRGTLDELLKELEGAWPEFAGADSSRAKEDRRLTPRSRP